MRKKSAEHLEMLFENRNKDYGAYDLRANYESRLIKSFGIALLIAGFFFLIPFVLTRILTRIHEEEKVPIYSDYNLTQKFIIEKEKKIVQPLASRTKVISNDIYKIVKKDEMPNEEKSVIPVDPGTPIQDAGSGTPSDNSSSQGFSTGSSDSTISDTFSAASVDVIPAFPGGEDAMLKFLSKNIHYSESGRGHNVTGKVYVSFIIDENGKVTDIRIMRGLGYGMEEEVVRVVSIMPDWTPGKYQGRNVKTALILPVRFSLE